MKLKKNKILYLIITAFLLFLTIPITYSKYRSTVSRPLIINVRKPEYDVAFIINTPNGTTGTGTMANQHFIYGVEQHLTKNTFSVDGAYFLKWNTKADGSGTSIDDLTSVKNLTKIDGSVVNLYAQWHIITKATLKYNGETLMQKMKALGGSNNCGYGCNERNITGFKRATREQYEAAVANSVTIEQIAEAPLSEHDAFMWYDSATESIYVYSDADKFSIDGSSARMFAKMLNLVDISALADFDMSNVTDTNRMFQDCNSIADLSPLANWDVSNVTDMTFMFGHSDTGQYMSITDLRPLANWNVSNVTSFDQMFKMCKYLTNLNGLENWDASNVRTFKQMFNRANLDDASAIVGWNVRKDANFDMMLANNPNLPNSSKPIFTSTPGTWIGNGTYSPT